MNIQSLSPEEIKWITKMEKCLKDMPKRLVMVEAADSLFLCDRESIKYAEIHDGKAHENGLVLHDFRNGTFKIQSTIA